MSYRVKEIVYTLQGEGANSGKAVVLCRFEGCNLNCSFCDTDFDGIDGPGGGEFEVIAKDRKKDLAILGRQYVGDPYQLIKPLKIPMGNPKDLEWGSFVYIIGYPMGHKMVTKGIISNPRDDESNSFLIDALFHRGFSGGIILAIPR